MVVQMILITPVQSMFNTLQILQTQELNMTLKIGCNSKATNSANYHQYRSNHRRDEFIIAFNVTNTLSYGNLFANQSNDPLDKVLTTTATGNVGLNQEHKGSGTGMCTDYPTCEVGTPILLSNQKYSLTASTSYSSATSLTGGPVEVALKVPKPTSTPQ